MSAPGPDVTRLLSDAGRGDRVAWDRLVPLVYDELKKIAAAEMHRERSGHTLQPTALVSEAYLRMVGQERANWNSRTQFYGAAAQAMRRILVDHARRRRAAKRGGDQQRTDLDEDVVMFEQRSTDLLALDAALERLATLDPQQARIVEMRFFGGMGVDETAGMLNVSPSTVDRAWRVARAWLLREVGGGDSAGGRPVS